MYVPLLLFCTIELHVAIYSFVALFIFALFALLQLVAELHHLLAFCPMTILRSPPVNLLALDATVAMGLAALAKLASDGV